MTDEQIPNWQEHFAEVVADGWYCRGCKRNVDVPVKEGQEAKCPYCGTVHRRATA